MRNYYFFNYKIMGKISKTLGALAFATTLSTTPVSADNIQSNEVKTEIVNVKGKTKQQLEAMAIENEIKSIQSQIKNLETKGFKNLSRKEKIKYDELTDNLIALENKKQADEIEKRKAYEEVEVKLSSIKGSLLSK